MREIPALSRPVDLFFSSTFVSIPQQDFLKLYSSDSKKLKLSAYLNLKNAKKMVA